MAGERRSRRVSGGSKPSATDEEDEIVKLQAERAAAAKAGPSNAGAGKYAGYANELADEEPEEDEPVRYVHCLFCVKPITAQLVRWTTTGQSSSRENLRARNILKILHQHFPTHPHKLTLIPPCSHNIHRKAPLSSFTAPKAIMNDLPVAAEEEDTVEARFGGSRRVVDRESDYSKRRFNRTLSPTKDQGNTSYADRLRESQLDRERDNTMRQIAQKQREEAEKAAGEARLAVKTAKESAVRALVTGEPSGDVQQGKGKRERTEGWVDDADGKRLKSEGEWEDQPPAAAAPPTRRRNRWDATPADVASQGGATGRRQRSRWDETPANVGAVDATPTHFGAGGETPLMVGSETPGPGQLTGMMTPDAHALAAAVAASGAAPMTPEQYNALRWEREVEERNKPLSDEDLDAMLPSDGYKLLAQPETYVPVRTPARKLMATPSIHGETPGGLYSMPDEDRGQQFDIPDTPEGLPTMKPEDYQYFSALLKPGNESQLSQEEKTERKIMKLLLKVKNGQPRERKGALRQLTDKARELGAGPLFNQILPLLMSPTLEDQERHLLVKVIDRILYKLDELVRPYVHKILVVIEPLLIDEDYYARIEGREIIGNLAKAAGLATMIAAMRPDIDNVDEYVRNTTARAFAVVAQSLGVPALLPFLKAVCGSKKSWQARHTGVKIVQQIAILLGCASLPHLRSLVEAIEHGLSDENQKVRTITALSIAALAEAAAPYGIESFDSVLKPLWKGIRAHRGKTLAAFLKAIGFIIPLMDAMYANYYTREVMVILIREFATADEEMKKITLKVVKQCVATEGVEAQYVRDEVMPDFFKHFWVRRMALDRRNYKALVETTLELALKCGSSDVISKITNELKDESEPFRRMVMETVTKVIEKLGTADIDTRLEELLIDGVLYAFQEQTADDGDVMLHGFGTVVVALGTRSKPYLPQICGVIKWRLNNKSAEVRQQAADLVSRVAFVMKQCDEEQLLGHLGVVLYEYLGEEFPDVLGSILGALKAVVNVVGMSKMTPPVKDLLPRLTPILKNRHEKVQENCIDLVGRVADRGAEFVPAREWMRICFELLEMLRATKKNIRRATVNTFGYIAKAIGPQDVLATLLNNLKVQERQNRVCTTVAIAIVAETCSPFTVLPALMNEYRVPELNVQNGVLKSLSFLFEYIGEMGKDYAYAVTPLLEDALMDRDLVHRQTAAVTVKHLALGCAGLGCEDAVIHLLNYVWPNIFETSPHVINAVMDAIEGCRVALGSGVMLGYVLQGLFHPARKVRETYWKLYNSAYIGGQEQLVPFYPQLEDEGENTYRRHELDVFL